MDIIINRVICALTLFNYINNLHCYCNSQLTVNEHHPIKKIYTSEQYFKTNAENFNYLIGLIIRQIYASRYMLEGNALRDMPADHDYSRF